MKLLAYTINGETVGIQVLTWSDADLNGNKPWLSIPDNDPVPPGYVDVTSIENWNGVGRAFKDYLYCRDRIQELVIAIVQPDYSNWNGLTLAQKQVACEYVLAPYVLRVPAIVTDAQDAINWQIVIEQTRGVQVNKLYGRERIIEEMRMLVAEYIRIDFWGGGYASLSVGQQFYKDTADLLDWFGFTAAPDFKYWLNNTVGTPYENDGFQQKAYYDVNIKNQLNAIYNGEY